MPSESPTKFYVTTPIYYVNARPHIGHAYTTVVADVLARRHRLLGDDVFFLTGTDEHGQKIERSAAAAGIPPQQFADGVSAEFQALWDRMGLTYNKFIRTTDPAHARGVQKLFAELYARGFIYLSTYTGAYCVSDEAFVDVPVGEPCPDCGRLTEQVTEENFFFKLSAFQAPLLNFIETGVLAVEPESRRNEVLSFLRGNVAAATTTSPDTGIQPEAKYGNDGVDTSHRSPFGLDTGGSEASPLGTPASAAVSEHEEAGGFSLDPGHQMPHAAFTSTGVGEHEEAGGFSLDLGHQMPHAILTSAGAGEQEGAGGFSPLNGAAISKGALAPGLPPAQPTLAYSDLGTPYVPGALKDLSISRSSFTWGIPVPEPAASAAAQKHVIYVWLDALANYMTAIGYGATTEEAQKQFHHYWPADLHLVGKEIIRFHCVYWPAFLLAAGLPLPKAITAHGWLLFDNSKMSKSKGNIVRTETILEAFGTLCPPIYEPAPNSLSSRPEAAGRSGETPVFIGASAGGTSPTPAEALGSTPPEGAGAFRPLNSALQREGASTPEGMPGDAALGKGTASAVPQTTPSENGALAPEVRPPTPHERDLFASDVLRYFLLREIPFGQDGSFSFDALITRYNADLANGYGNLVSRTLNMIQQYFGGEYQDFTTDFYFDFAQYQGTSNQLWISFGDVEAARRDPKFQARADDQEPGDSLAQAVETYIYDLQFTQATDLLMQAVGVVDGYLTRHAPWKLAKQEGARDRLVEVLMNAAEAVKYLTACAHDILPYATARVWAQLGLGDIEIAAANGELKNLQWGCLKPGTKLGPLAPIFPRADKGLAQIMTDLENGSASSLNSSKLVAERDPSELDSSQLTAHSGPARPESPLKQAFTPAPAAPVPNDPTHPAAPPIALDEPSGVLPVAGSTAQTTGPDATPSHAEAAASGPFASVASQASITANPADASPQITIDDFAKVELRVAEVKVCERIPKADKLLRLEVDLGHEQRQILSGIAEFYTPEDLLGRRIIVITNLAPRKMRGLDSHGMLLAASGPEGGKPILATVPDGVPLGSRLK